MTIKDLINKHKHCTNSVRAAKALAERKKVKQLLNSVAPEPVVVPESNIDYELELRKVTFQIDILLEIYKSRYTIVYEANELCHFYEYPLDWITIKELVEELHDSFFFRKERRKEYVNGYFKNKIYLIPYYDDVTELEAYYNSLKPKN